MKRICAGLAALALVILNTGAVWAKGAEVAIDDDCNIDAVVIDDL